MVGTLHFHCKGHGFSSWLENQDLVRPEKGQMISIYIFFFREDIQIANKHIKQRSTSLSIREMEIKTPTRITSYSLTLKKPYIFVMLLLLLSRFSRVRLCATQWTAAHQAPPSLIFSRQEHWSGLPFPSPMHESEK